MSEKVKVELPKGVTPEQFEKWILSDLKSQEKQRRRQKCERRALKELKGKHIEEYLEILAKELRAYDAVHNPKGEVE